MKQQLLSAAETGAQNLVNPTVLEWTDKITNLAYLVAALLFILALAGLAKQQTASRGNRFGIAGMTIALIATIVKAVVNSINGGDASTGPLVTVLLIAVAMLLGAAIGIPRAKKVEMTEMPELIAMLHSFVGVGRRAYRRELLYPAGRAHEVHRGVPPGRGLPGCVHRCGDAHGLHRGVSQAIRKDGR